MVGTVKWDRLQKLFHEAIDLGDAERNSLLDRECGGDTELRRQVETLLRLDGDDEVFSSALGEAAGQFAAAAEPAPGRRLGPYRIVRLLGRGGMGSVFLAERADEQFTKQVALKTVWLAGRSRETLARFRTERQILAKLEHPNIARLLDGGETEEGAPFVVMEYVDGAAIDQYSREHHLSVRERLGLFRQLCDAVAYAHRNLIIHRDLKPGNVLVCDGLLKLLDFGIAKLLEPDGMPSNMTLTQAGDRLMTPDYASPEQVRGERITTASDIYSLGVLLYELLAGERPFCGTGLTPGEFERAICTEEPLKPSMRAPRQGLDGDLDRIVLKAMHKDPARRYSSADQFAEDLRRWSDGHPVLARSDSWMYRGRKFAGRHKVGIAAVAAIIASLTVGLVAARTEQRKAERRFAQVREIASTFLFEFHDAILNLPGATPARKLVVDRAVGYLDGLAAEAGDDWALQSELAQAYQRVASLQYSAGGAHLGRPEDALRSLDHALKLYESVARRRPQDPGIRARLVEVSAHRATIYLNSKGDLAEARKIAQQDLPIAMALAHENGLDDVSRRRVAIALRDYATITAAVGKPAEALPTLQESAQLYRSLVEANPKNPEDAYYYAWDLIDIGDMLGGGGREIQLGDREGALSQYRLAELYLRKIAEDRTNAKAQRSLSALFSRFAGVYRAIGKPQRAIPYFQQSIASAEKLVAADPANVEYQRDLAIYWNNLGGAFTDAGDLVESRRALLHAENLRETLSRRMPGEIRFRADLASTYHNLAETEWKSRRTATAETYAKKAIAIREPAVKHNPSLIWRQAKTWDLLAQLHEARAKWREASEDYVHALQLFQQLADAGKLSPSDRDEPARLQRKLEAVRAHIEP